MPKPPGALYRGRMWSKLPAFTRALAPLIALAAGFSAPLAHTQPVDGGMAIAELIADHKTAAPGQTITAALTLKMDAGWHVYWQNAGDAGLPPELIVSDASQIPASALGEFAWPIPHLLPVVAGEIMDYGYDDEVVLPFSLNVPKDAEGEITLTATADYLICQEICIPETADVQLRLTIGTPLRDALQSERIAGWQAKVPIDFPGAARFSASETAFVLSLKGPLADVTALRFFPFDHAIVHSADQPLSLGPAGATLTLAPDKPAPATLDGVIVATAKDGARTGYVIRAAQGETIPGTSGTPTTTSDAAGLNTLTPTSPASLLALIGLALLGGLILNLMPCVLPVLSMKALGMVDAAAHGKAGSLRAHGLWYLAGVLIAFAALAAIIVAVRAATQETLSLGFQLQSAPTVAILALIMFAIGLWMMGFFELGASIQNTGDGLARSGGNRGAFFTGVLAAVVGAPCVGPFLGAALGAVMSAPALAVFAVFLAMGLGLALPFVLLSFVPGLQRLLPKPGRWMDTLKQFFAFPLFLTMAWLLAVLGQLKGPSAVAWTLAAAIAIAFAVWAARKGNLGRVVAGLALIGGVALAGFTAAAPAPASGTSLAYATKYQTESWSPERVAELNGEGRAIFIDFTAAWCATCQVNKSTTLKTRAVQDAFEKANVAFLVADFTRKDAVIAAELQRRNRAGVPMYLWYAPGATEPEILPEILSPALVTALVSPKSSSSQN